MKKTEQKSVREPLLNSPQQSSLNDQGGADPKLVVNPNMKLRSIPMEPDQLMTFQKTTKDNMVRSSRYTVITFLPLNLIMQCVKPANLYFILMTFLQLIPAISITDGQPAMLPPLMFVIIVSMVKDAYEDYLRHKKDKEENEAKCIVISRDGFETKTRWRDVRVGQVVKVLEDQFIPADIMLINSELEDGICYVETKNLDGETNLKHKVAPKELNQFMPNKATVASKLTSGILNCEEPNNQIYKFEGNMILPDGCTSKQGNMIALSNDQVILRGMSLRNTPSVMGIVLYTGHQTKIQMNCQKASYKNSKVMGVAGTQIVYVLILQIVMATVAALVGTMWILKNQHIWYMSDPKATLETKKDPFYTFFTTLGTWVLIFTNFVPISLYVTLELVKFWQGSFMEYDMDMYDEEQDMRMSANCTNINEELGQIEYIFSDKTGTLTCNVMELLKYSTLTESCDLGSGETDFLKSQDHIDVLMHLALCHTVIIDPRSGKYNSSSPDELALVQGAANMGFVFENRDAENNVKVKGQDMYQVLNVLEFSSDRKRMSVVLRHVPSGQISLYTKGADSVIEKLLASGQNQELVSCMKFVNEFAVSGLRTLLLTKRMLTNSEYEQWNNEWQAASTAIQGRDELIAEVNSKIEMNLTLVGSTAIEDKLQDGVPDAIKAIKAAGINLWVLTGDKIETAINIGYSAGLLDDSMVREVIETADPDAIQEQMMHADILFNSKEVIDSGKFKALVIAGDALSTVQANERLQDQMLRLTDQISVVLACRVSPKQKADIVQMVKQRFPSKKTLSIGDGANDVPMIMKADVGVGIAGKEGMQAARCSDFAIGQFRFIIPLMFVHGRECYRRNTDLICWNFYKNIVYVTPQFYFGFFSAFSGQTLYESWIYQIYNTLYTAFPVMWYALCDQQYEKEVLKKTPRLYHMGMKDKNFSTRVFWGWMFYALFQGGLILIFELVLNQMPASNSTPFEGRSYDMWCSGHVIYGTVLIVVNLALLKLMNNLTGVGEALIVFSVVSFWVTMYIFNFFSFSHELYHLFWQVVASPPAWIGMIFCSGWLFTIDSVFSTAAKWHKAGSAAAIFDTEVQNRSDKYRDEDFQHLTHNSEDDLHDSLRGAEATTNQSMTEMQNLAVGRVKPQSGYAFSEMERKPTIVNKK